jgi:hypothetical protein
VNTTVAGTVSTEIMRIVNTYSGLSAEQRGELASRARAFDAATDQWPIPANIFSAEHRARIEALYQESNRRLAEDFVRQPLDGFWFREDARPEAAPVAAPA